MALANITNNILTDSGVLVTNLTPTTRTLTINGTAYDLSADRSWTIATGVGGSGTTNYLPKFTGASTIGNSLIFDDGSGIRIGATSHALASNRRLTVVGASGIEAVATGTGGEPTIEMWQKHTSGDNVFAYFFTEAAATTRGYLQYDRSGNRLNLVGSGNGLLFTGASTFSSSVTANNLVIRNSGVPAAQFYRDLDVTVVGAAGQGIEFGARSGSTFISGASIYGVLDNPATTGSIVLQTLTAGSLTTKLTIASTGAATFSSSVTATSLILGNGNNLTWGGAYGANIPTIIGVSGASGYLTFYPSGSTNGEAARFTNNGNFGIGTTSPAALFHIEKSSNSGSGSAFPRINVVNSLGTQGDGSSTFNFADIRISAGNGAVDMFLSTTFASGTWAPAAIINVATNHDLQFKTNNTERMRITSGGALCVGRTTAYSAGYLLNVEGNIYASAQLECGTSIQTGAPTNGTARQWKLGNAVSGTISTNYYIIVEINGTTYSIPALQGLP